MWGSIEEKANIKTAWYWTPIAFHFPLFIFLDNIYNVTRCPPILIGSTESTDHIAAHHPYASTAFISFLPCDTIYALPLIFRTLPISRINFGYSFPNHRVSKIQAMDWLFCFTFCIADSVPSRCPQGQSLPIISHSLHCRKHCWLPTRNYNIYDAVSYTEFSTVSQK